MTSRDTTPLIYVTVIDPVGNEQRLTEQTHRITNLSYTDSESKADRCVLTVDNFDLSHFDDPVFRHRNLVRVTWGYAGRMALQRELVITKISGFQTLQVEAKAKSVVMDTEKRSRTFAGMTRSQIVEQIAKEYGYSGATAFIQQTGTRYEHTTQYRLTDAQMIRKLAHQQGYEFYVDHSGFHWHERKLLQAPARSFTWYTDRGRGEVLNVHVETDITRRPKEVTRVALDPSTKTISEATASDTADADREGTASTLLVAEDDLQSAALQQVYEPSDVNMSVDNSPPKVAAKRQFRNTQRGAVKIELEAIGDPYVLAKTVFSLAGVGSRLSGNYYLKEVVHTVGPGQYQMKLKGVSDGLGPSSRKAVPPGENGLPEVAATPSSAKRVDASEAPAGLSVDGQSVDPAELVPVPVRDAGGNEIGTGFAVRAATSTAIVDGSLATVED